MAQGKNMIKKSSAKGLKSFIMDAVLWNLSGSLGYQIFLCFLAAFMVLGIYAYSVQAHLGLSATGMNDIVSL